MNHLSVPLPIDAHTIGNGASYFTVDISNNLHQHPVKMTGAQGRRLDFTKKVHAKSYSFIDPLALNISGRKVLVTGAARQDGVGYATALAFAKAGASIIALTDVEDIGESHGVNLKQAAVQAGREEPMIVHAKADISKFEEVDRLKKELSKALGDDLDIIVNNAAHQEPYKPILDADMNVYWRTWEVNILGLFNMSRAFLPILLSTRSSDHHGLGTMINVTSSGALSVRPGGASYRTSKLAVLRWTEALYAEHDKDGLLAFCVNPGAIKTQMTINEPEHIRNMLPHQPEIAGDTIVWLASQRLNWLGGRYVSCPWDMEELMERKEEVIRDNKLKMRMYY